MAKEQTTKKEVKSFMTPEGRLINNSLFEKDTFTDERGREGTPSYKIEMAFSPKDVRELEDEIVNVACDEWGDRAEKDYDAGKIESPLKNGDDLAASREEKGKSGEAYEGKIVLRASTIYNGDGQDASGGVYVADEDGEKLPFTERSKVFNGSYGVAVVSFSPYEISGRRGVKAYLQGYQYTKDGEPLRTNKVAGMFKPLARGAGRGRSRRD